MLGPAAQWGAQNGGGTVEDARAHPEEVEIDVRHGEDRPQERDALRLWKPREQDAEYEEAVKDLQEVDAALDEDDLGQGVGRQDEGEWLLPLHGWPSDQ